MLSTLVLAQLRSVAAEATVSNFELPVSTKPLPKESSAKVKALRCGGSPLGDSVDAGFCTTPQPGRRGHGLKFRARRKTRALKVFDFDKRTKQ